MPTDTKSNEIQERHKDLTPDSRRELVEGMRGYNNTKKNR